MTSSRLFVLSVLSLALGACTSIPKSPTTVLVEPNVAMIGGYGISASDTQTLGDQQTPNIASTGWQDFYDDDKLKALIALGLENNKSLEMATLAVQSASAQYQISRVSSFVKPTIGVGYQRTGNGGRSDSNSSGSYSAQLGLSSYEIDFWGRVASQKEQALQDFFATQADKGTAQIALISEIASAYVSMSYALAQLQLAQSTVESREKSLFIAKKRFEAGIDSKTPLLHATSSLEGAKLAVINAQTALIKAKNGMELLLGSPMPRELIPEPAITQIVSQKVLNAGLPSDLLYYRPDIVSAEHKLKSAGANITVARAAFFPSVSLSGSVGFGAGRLADLFDGNSWSFGPNIHIPIFDYGTRRANYQVAQIAQKQALSNYERTIQTAFKEVKDVLADRATMDERLSAQYRLQDNFQESYMIAYETYRAGLSGYLEVLDVERSLFDSQQSILDIERQKVLSQIELYKVLGGGATLVQENNQATARLATAQEVLDNRSERSPKVVRLNTPADSDTATIQNTDSDTPPVINDGTTDNQTVSDVNDITANGIDNETDKAVKDEIDTGKADTADTP